MGPAEMQHQPPFRLAEGFHAPDEAGQAEAAKTAAAAVEQQGAADAHGFDDGLPCGDGAACEVGDFDVRVGPDRVSHVIETMAQGDVLGGEGVGLVEPAGLAEDVRADQEAGAVEGPGLEQAFFHGPFRGTGLVDPMEIVSQIAAGGPGGAAEGLDAAVGENDLRGDGGGRRRQPGEVFQQAVDERHADSGVIVDDETEPAAGAPEGQVVVLGEAAQLRAFLHENGRILCAKVRQVFGGIPIRHHEDFQRGGGGGIQVVQARIQEIRPVHGDDDDADVGHGKRLPGRAG